MCNLYRMTKNKDEVAQWFDAIDELGGANFGAEVFPGYPGAVVAEDRLAQMTWGFPLVLKGKNGQPLKPRPVNNARTDKLDSFFWRYSFEERRCLIPVTAWAEAEGPKGGKTRTWLSRPDAELFAVAGVWRDSEEWGRCYSMVMTDACGAAAECHTRMPVLLREADRRLWTQGAPEDAFALCRPWEGDLVLDRTAEPWAGGASAATSLL
ncbi:SOS response-associated peptidase family protein [Qipengyuania flava]|uniref:SOS response-associated peptidase n=1 Tax=Qipengyuania flava TaxID=192812 RepID=UPI001ADB4DD4|nr:SOS response-associated peptidase family protein [Qipengyuania flava]MBO9503235.1 SOS response-associated peptidase family protein [Qipengyuania flava]